MDDSNDRYSPKYRPSSPSVIDVDIEDPEEEEPARPIGEDDLIIEVDDDQPRPIGDDDDDDHHESIQHPESEDNEPLIEEDFITDTEPQT